MRILIQRVKSASVSVDNQQIASINSGLLLFLGIKKGDVSQQISKLVNKVLDLRIFNDDNNKMNLSLKDTQKDILLVSQFTLYGNCSKGRRPSYDQAESPEIARQLYQKVIDEFEEQYRQIQTGRFAAMMDVKLLNDGPVTLLLED